MNVGKAILNSVHDKLVFGRRVHILAEVLTKTLREGDKILDVGAGDGSISARIMQRRPDIDIQGIDVLVRSNTLIPITPFDGDHLPFANESFDCVMFVDVLHHTTDPAGLVSEAGRVAKSHVVIKDHLLQGTLAGPTLRFMDWVGNRGHDVALPYNYLQRGTWHEIFDSASLDIEIWSERLGLYSAPAAWLFERSLHFVTRLRKRRRTDAKSPILD
jgi:SAM-dependent methyltransferase